MKVFTGIVISKKMAKTASVSVERVVQHPLYGKRLKRTRTYHVHDEMDVKVGDVVRFVATKPYSKTKRWIITQVAGGTIEEVKAMAPKAAKKEPKAKKTAVKKAEPKKVTKKVTKKAK